MSMYLASQGCQSVVMRMYLSNQVQREEAAVGTSARQHLVCINVRALGNAFGCRKHHVVHVLAPDLPPYASRHVRARVMRRCSGMPQSIRAHSHVTMAACTGMSWQHATADPSCRLQRLSGADKAAPSKAMNTRWSAPCRRATRARPGHSPWSLCDNAHQHQHRLVPPKEANDLTPSW